MQLYFADVWCCIWASQTQHFLQKVTQRKSKETGTGVLIPAKKILISQACKLSLLTFLSSFLCILPLFPNVPSQALYLLLTPQTLNSLTYHTSHTIPHHSTPSILSDHLLTKEWAYSKWEMSISLHTLNVLTYTLSFHTLPSLWAQTQRNEHIVNEKWAYIHKLSLPWLTHSHSTPSLQNWHKMSL